MSGLDPRRLRLGEIVGGASAVLLLIFMFVPSWYALNGTLSQTAGNLGAQTTWNGWWALSGWRYLTLVTIVAALALTYFQAAREGPAIPITLSMIVTVLGGLNTVGVIYRILAGPPSGASLLHAQVGPYLGLVAALGITYGGYRSMREEGGADPTALEIETIRLQNGP